MARPTTFTLAAGSAEEALEAAASALDLGELVIVPTETVYGVAAREDRPEGRRRMDRLKAGRQRPYSLAVDTPERLGARLAPLSPIATRIGERWWPGPVTQVLATRDGDTLGVRVPGDTWTRALIAHADAALLLSSANRSGVPAPAAVADVQDEVLEQVSVVVDGGRAALGEGSTVVRAAEVCLRVLREGVVSRKDLRDHAAGRVLVVCSGNTCRSPMGALLLQAAFAALVREDPALLPPHVLSAGLATAGGAPASSHARDAMEARGLTLGPHRSRPVDGGLLAVSDLVLAMTHAHVAQLVDVADEFGFRVELFDPGGADVEDPFGGPPEVYEACARQLEAMAAARARVLAPPTEALA